jgi:signal transduction histidine kinase
VSVTALRDAQGVIIGYLLIGTDNTARKLVEAEQRKLDQRLRDQTALLSEANEEIQRFVYIVSHDLRSPLVNIPGFGQPSLYCRRTGPGGDAGGGGAEVVAGSAERRIGAGRTGVGRASP